MILFVNGCARKNSRTLELAKTVLSTLEGDITEVRLYPDGPAGLSAESLKLRDSLTDSNDFSHPMFDRAKQFASADTIVIAAPYWNLSFPARVLAYFEEITVTGLTFKYSEKGIPESLCKASRLIYVTTAGGPIFFNSGYDYVKTISNDFFGIGDIRLVKAEKLDIYGMDAAAILEKAKQDVLENRFDK